MLRLVYVVLLYFLFLGYAYAKPEPPLLFTSDFPSDHNNHGFSMLPAGGGIKGGLIYGATDDFGFKEVDKLVNPNDVHATIVQLLGLDHTKLTYRYSGRDFRLTDVEGKCY